MVQDVATIKDLRAHSIIICVLMYQKIKNSDSKNATIIDKKLILLPMLYLTNNIVKESASTSSLLLYIVHRSNTYCNA